MRFVSRPYVVATLLQLFGAATLHSPRRRISALTIR